jgi:hypothetical protein
MASWKAVVRVATTPGLDLPLETLGALPKLPAPPLPTIDDVDVAIGDRVLVKDQIKPWENGIYIVGLGLWKRAPDADQSAGASDLPPSNAVTPEMAVRVSEGTVNAHTEWFLISQGPIWLQAPVPPELHIPPPPYPVFARLLPWADVTAFGARGNGTTDDSGSINAAINSGAGIVLFPPGKYKIENDVTFPASVAVQFVPGAVLMLPSPTTQVTVNGPIIATDTQQIFSLPPPAGGIKNFAQISPVPPIPININVSHLPLGPYENHHFEVQISAYIPKTAVAQAIPAMFRCSIDNGPPTAWLPWTTPSLNTKGQSSFNLGRTGVVIQFPNDNSTYITATTYTFDSAQSAAATALTIATSMLSHVSVRWWGARGDGSVDPAAPAAGTNAIQAALNAVTGLSGNAIGKLLIPPGIYVTTYTLFVVDTVGPVIEANGASLWWQGDYSDSSGNPTVLLNFESVFGAVVRGLSLFCPPTSRLAEGIRLSASAVPLLVTHTATRCSFYNCGLSGQTDEVETCVRIGGGADQNNDFHSLTNCSFANYGDSAVWIESSQAKQIQFINCLCQGFQNPNPYPIGAMNARDPTLTSTVRQFASTDAVLGRTRFAW